MRVHLAILIGTLVWASLAVPTQAQNVSIYRSKLFTKSIDQILKEHPLPSNRNLQSTLIETSKGSSLHLVQIRTREKLHKHKTHDLLMIMEKGEGILHIGKENQSMKIGDMVLIPRGVPHYFETTSKEVSVGIGIFTPPFDGKDVVPVKTPE